MTTELTPVSDRIGMLDLRDTEQIFKFCDTVSKSALVPSDFRGKPADIMIAIQMGAEVGLKPLAALKNIAVINGRASLWGDAVLGLVRASGLLQDIKETDDGQEATCEVLRRGEETPKFGKFSIEDAKRAGLAGKSGPWSTYPKRMRQMRARAFALRDAFPDVLGGLHIAEEAQDLPPPPPTVDDLMPKRLSDKEPAIPQTEIIDCNLTCAEEGVLC